MNEPTPQAANTDEVQRLLDVIAGLEQTSKMLVRRDIDLRQAYNQLKSLDSEKTEFVSIAAHQLRTPVTTARWALQHLSSDASSSFSEKQLTLLNQTSSSVEHIYNLVEELLELNRIDFGGIEMKCKPSSLEKLCLSVLDDHLPEIEKKGINVTKRFSDQTQVVNFDQNRLKDAVDNLIDNAVKYTDTGGTIEVSIQYKNNIALIKITDSGIGVEKGLEEKIFNKFTRLGNAESVDPNGIGLGLYISRKIAEKHSGSLSFAHNYPRGAIFSLEIPC